jgi:hypothetical protein
MISRARIDEIELDNREWLIEGVICPWLTLLSGQPKHGKSIFAGHVAISLIKKSPLLDREIYGENHLIGWMGYDAGWKEEIIERWSAQADNQIIAYDPIRNLNVSEWTELGLALKSDGVTLFVLDHLYGMAGALGLNDADQFAILANLLRPIYEDFGIAVLLLAQAGRSEYSRGRAAHSVAIEGEARALIRISDKRAKGARKIEFSSNTGGEEVYSITLTPEELSVRAKRTNLEPPSQRTSPDKVRDFLDKANSTELTTWTGVGRELHRLGHSKTIAAGRQMSTRWRDQNLLQMVNGSVVPGESLVVENNYQYK